MFRALVPLLLSLLAYDATAAQQWTLGRLPTKRSQIGFTMTVDVEAVSGNGYQPVRLTFVPQGSRFLRDRHVSVELSPEMQYYRASAFRYSVVHSLTLPEGAPAVTETVHVPYYYRWSNVRVTLAEDGREVDFGSLNTGTGSDLRRMFAGQRVTVGIVRAEDADTQGATWSTFPDIRTLVTVLGDGPLPEVDKNQQQDRGAGKFTVSPRLSHRESIALAGQVQPAWVQFRLIDEATLPENWLGYSQLDLVVAAAPLLDRVAAAQPQCLDALRLWIASGGNLWMHAAAQGDGKFSAELKLDVVAQNSLVGPQAVTSYLRLNERNDTSDLINDGWYGAQKASSHYSGPQSNDTYSQRADVLADLQRQRHPFAALVPTEQIAPRIRLASLGLGQVVAIMDEDPYPGSFQFWQSIKQLQGERRLQWIDRHGIDVPAGNEAYWTWRIPSVGQPPVKSFVLLNFLFALVVGPVCYRMLRGQGRLYLLYFVAPCLALLVTIGLFAYALASDGIGSKQRTRQITWLDPQHGFHVSQSRETYYRVWGLDQQIRLPRDAAIYPVHHTAARYSYRSSNLDRGLGTYRVNQNQQQLGGGFLPTRNQVQYQISRPWSAAKTVSVDWRTATISNDLTVSLVELVVCDADGKLWQAADVKSGAVATLKPCRSVKLALDQFQRGGMLPASEDVPFVAANVYRQDSRGVEFSLLEERLREWSRRLPRQAFIGVAEIDRDKLALPHARILDSIHVVMGKLP